MCSDDCPLVSAPFGPPLARLGLGGGWWVSVTLRLRGMTGKSGGDSLLGRLWAWQERWWEVELGGLGGD